ncbi:glycosyltransferase family 4 protein [Thioalkalivibrio thiocyanodenitrificans]|uniref:glycosyltransferase family 4 protein n=1 Tax=Thioalkalivibrio thiocyanodenitrificans TaxID=243063 RepID=UPI00036A48D1|nr:glycosyltransferase family 1 protein [Thioalkalivibrio thiocyanodenitrificans]
MRIVIDMHGAQTESRFRGIGRYTMSFAQAVVRNRGEHEVILALSGLFPDTIEIIRAAFDGLIPQESIRVWHAPDPAKKGLQERESRYEVAQLLREAFLESLQPDVVHLSSLFEGFSDSAAANIGCHNTSYLVSVSLYDLIPLLNPDQYLKPYPEFARFYESKLREAKKAALYLTISESSRQEAIRYLGVPEESVVNISTATEPRFGVLDMKPAISAGFRRKLSLTRPFILYTGGADDRKNLARLIQAFGKIPQPLRSKYQLLLAGMMPEYQVAQLKHKARVAGLEADDVCFTGYISDDDLIKLYNFCEFFVFPSWHEGFGLPALEAMACGAPVIGSNTSSIPEVIGLDDALFDPFDVDAIAAKMVRVLEDGVFRAMLREHGLKQAKTFAWDDTARRAFNAWESVCDTRERHNALGWSALSASAMLVENLTEKISRNKADELPVLADCLAKNHAAGSVRQLFVDVSEISRHDAATGIQRVVRSYLNWLLQLPPPGFRVEPIYATQNEGYRYARRFSQRFLGQDATDASDDPVRWQRGDVFFGLDMQHHVQLAHASFYRQLMQDGVTVKFLVYDLLPIKLADLFKDSNAKELHERWLTLIAGTDGAVCISKATADAFETWINEAGVPRSPTFRTCWVHIGGDIDGSNPSRGLPGGAEKILETLRQRPTLLCVSTLEPRKQQQQVLEAVEQLWQEGTDLNLVLVGQEGWQTESLANRLRSHYEQGKRLYWLEGISDEYLERVYAASTCLVAASIDEGFGLSLIEAARHGIPIIARDIPVFREVAGRHAYYFCGETPHDFAQALKAWLGLYHAGQHPHSTSMPWSTWQESAEKLKTALIEQNYPRRQLLVDVSELVQRDARTGIQRVVRTMLRELLSHPPNGYRIEPVYAALTHGYRYARRFTCEFFGGSPASLPDELVDCAPGDIFFGLDLQPQSVPAQTDYLHKLHQQGVSIYFMVYDLIAVNRPEFFPKDMEDCYQRWLQAITQFDGAVCISKSVAQELREWLCKQETKRLCPYRIDWIHLGTDNLNMNTVNVSTDKSNVVLRRMREAPSFVMVGTLEPRKGHAQVLAAFDLLWRRGVDVNLVIVGKGGWMVDKLMESLRNHSERDRRLFWLDGICDKYLDQVYSASDCLIAASEAEGFGLPIIEAAKHSTPIIARDIPVFREVAGAYAYYFPDNTSPEVLERTVQEWLALYEKDSHPKSDLMPWMTWEQSARQLLDVVLERSIESETLTEASAQRSA